MIMWTFIAGMLFAKFSEHIINLRLTSSKTCFPFYSLIRDLGPFIIGCAALAVSMFAFFYPYKKDRDEIQDQFISARNLACYATRLVIPRIEEAIRGDFIDGQNRRFQPGKSDEYDIVIYGMEKIDYWKVSPPQYTDQLLDILRSVKIFDDWQAHDRIIGSEKLTESDVCGLRNRIADDIRQINAYAESEFGTDLRLSKCSNSYKNDERMTRRACDKYMAPQSQ